MCLWWGALLTWKVAELDKNNNNEDTSSNEISIMKIFEIFQEK